MKDTTLHGHARAIKTLLLFWHEEGYIPERVRFDMPKLAEKKLPVWDDLDMGTGAVKVLRGKGNKYRVVFCGAKTRRQLLKYRRTLTDQEGRVFPLKDTGLRSALLRIGERAGIQVTAHALRRTFATMSLRSGMSLAHVSALLGHAEISTTQIYLRLLVDDLREAHEKNSPIDNL